jgi:hypothetical protein
MSGHLGDWLGAFRDCGRTALAPIEAVGTSSIGESPVFLRNRHLNGKLARERR